LNNVFNWYLWEKLGKSETSIEHSIPVLNLEKNNLEGEMWKLIEGLEGIFEVSNL